jgi:hypothetical protein
MSAPTARFGRGLPELLVDDKESLHVRVSGVPVSHAEQAVRTLAESGA